MIADICPKCRNMDTVIRKGSTHYSALISTDYVCPDCLTEWNALFEITDIRILREE